MTLVATTTFDADAERWAAGLRLVGAWLMEQSGNTRAAYSDSIGWPYRPDGTWRGYHTTRNGMTWLGWCHTRGVHLFNAKRVHVLAWVDDTTASRSDTGQTLSKRIATLAGLDDPQSVHPHVARHTYITEARRQGYAGDVIQHSVGHANIEQTDKYGKHIINIEKSPAYGVAAAFEPQS